MRETNRNKGQAGAIYESLIRSIIVGEFEPGESLTELRLASRFETSRTPVREACIHLNKEGFLRTNRTGKGYIITELSIDDVQQLYLLRCVLEPISSQMAASASLTDDFFSTMLQHLDTQKRVFADELRTYEAFLQLVEAEYGFHVGIAEASGNKWLAKFTGEIMNQILRFQYATYQKSEPAMLEPAIDKHHEILDAIRSHDASSASQLMYDHIRTAMERAIQIIFAGFSRPAARQRDFFSPPTNPARTELPKSPGVLD